MSMLREGAMSATDELRQMLTEAGVEWDYGITGAASTKFNANGVELTFIGMRDGVTCSTILTPAQAVAATLGRDNAGRYVGLRQGEYWERAENSNYYCGGCGWKVTDHDSYCPECGGALHKATLGRGTCQMECAGRPTERTLDVMSVYFCSKCGSPIYNDCMPSYCIYCGAEVTL